MMKFQNWMKKNPVLNILLLVSYYLLVVLPHEQVGLAINGFFRRFPRSTYNQIILVLCVFLVLLTALILWKKIKIHPERTKIIAGFAFTIGVMSLVNSFLFVINIESVHYVQYAVFAILVFPLAKNYFGALFMSTIAGTFDEAYQYFYLTPNSKYFDFNDVITNLLGAAFGLLVLRSFNISSNLNDDGRSFKRSFLIPCAIFGGLMIGLLATPLLSVYPSSDRFNLVKVKQEFWTHVYPNATFHVVAPLEGMFYLVFLFGIYYYFFEYKKVV